MIRLITNNPQAKSWWQDQECENFVIHYLESGLEGVLTEARKLVHAGWILINHPLSSSIKPNQSPFKTLVLVKTNRGLDYQSLSAIEISFEALRKLGTFPGAAKETLTDLQLIDLDLCKPLREQLWEEC